MFKSDRFKLFDIYVLITYIFYLFIEVWYPFGLARSYIRFAVFLEKIVRYINRGRRAKNAAALSGQNLDMVGPCVSHDVLPWPPVDQ